MNQFDEQRVPGFRRMVAGAVAAATLVMVAGCGGQDDVSRTIAESRNTLEAMAGGGSAPRAVRENRYAEVVGALSGIAQGGDGESASLAQALLAEALAGQGELLADDFRRADAELMRSLSAANAAVNLYIEQRGLEAALRGYDPQQDLAKLDQFIEQRRQERATAEQLRQSIAAQRDELLARASELERQAAAIRASEGEVSTRALAAGTKERLPLVESAHEQRRQWQQLMKQADEIRADAAQFDPQIAEAELRVQQAARQITSSEDAKRQALARAEKLREGSADAARAAEEAARAVATALGAVRSAFEEGSAPAFERAAEKYERALNSAGNARGTAARAGANVSVASIAHALASLRREQAESVRRVAALFAWAGSVEPRLSAAREYQETGARLNQQAAEALSQAAEAYERAAGAFQTGASGAADAAERMQKLGAELEELRRRIAGEPEPEQSAPTGEDDDGASDMDRMDDMGQHDDADAPMSDMDDMDDMDDLGPGEEPAPE